MTGRSVAHAIDALRRGWPVAIRAAGEASLNVLAIETADHAALDNFAPAGAYGVLISHGRASTLKITNQRAAAAPDSPVFIRKMPWFDLESARALADPSLDLMTPMKGPFQAEEEASPFASAAALQLARMAGLLPAFFTDGIDPEATVDAPSILAFEGATSLKLSARARLPVEGAEDVEIVAFRHDDSGNEHVALLIGEPNGTIPLVRLHSECLTGDVFGSLKCDCGPQLHQALRLIGDSGWGILLYLRQEGRGIGLINKLRAYQLQDQGFDTVDANLRLGLPVDARGYAIAARMLTLLGQDQVRLLTNNPAKMVGLEAAGITVAERVAHALPPNPHNAAYLATKRDRTGHI